MTSKNRTTAAIGFSWTKPRSPASTALQYTPKHHAGRAEHRDVVTPTIACAATELGCFFMMRGSRALSRMADQEERR